MCVVSRTKTIMVNPARDEILTLTNCVGYILHHLSYASPVCKDSPMVCMKTTWRCYGVCWNVSWSPHVDFKAWLWICSGVIPCSAHLGDKISSHHFGCLREGFLIAHQWGSRRSHCAQASPLRMFSCKSKTPCVPMSACIEVTEISDKYQLSKLTADKKHFNLPQKSFHGDCIYKMQSNGK